MRDIILGGLLLPLKIYFRPDLFRAEVTALAPNLSANYSLWQARHKLRVPEFRSRLFQLFLQVWVAFLWVPLLASMIQSYGIEIRWSGIITGIMVGVAGSLLVSWIFGVMSSVPVSLVTGIVFGIELGLTLDVAENISRGIAWGLVIGVIWGMVWRGIAANVVRMVADVIWSIVGGLISGIALSLNLGIMGGIAFTITHIVICTHSPFLPIQALLSSTIAFLIRLRPAFAPTLWRLSPVRWDAIILLPLPGLSDLLVTLYRQHPTLGQEAINEVSAHRYQYPAAAEALATLALEDAMAVASLPALAAFGRGLGWLSEDTKLPETTRKPLLRMRDISQEVASTIESESAANQVRRLVQASGLLKDIRLQPSPFGTALANWAKLIATDLEKARQRQHEIEPIPQIYQSDGKPIDPWQEHEQMLPFKGRESLFSQLETALGGERHTTFFLYGQRRTGKTSVLKYLPQRLGSQVVPTLLDLQGFGNAETINGIIEGMTQRINDDALRHADLKFPSIDSKKLERDPYAAFQGWLDQVERVLGARTLLLALDEFEELEQAIADGRIDDRILKTIRNIVQHRRQIAVLMSGSHQLDELPPHWSSTLVNTETLPISFLSEDDTRNLIEQPVADFPAIYTPEAVDTIVRITHCQPYLVQLVCALLVERMNSMRRIPPTSYVTPDDVETVISLALERGSAYFDNLWRAQTKTVLAQRVLAKLAAAPNTALDGAALRQIERDEMALAEALRVLQRREIIIRDNGCYRIVVPLVAHYVRRETSV